MTMDINHYIHGQEVVGSAPALHPIFNPATGETITHLRFANHSEIEAAIASAKNAFTTWSVMPAIRRARILFKYKELLEANIDTLAQHVTREHGKTVLDAKGSIQRGIEAVEVACGITKLQQGVFSEEVGTGVDCYTIRQPLGVCVGITPFNFPVMIPLWMLSMALACGNTFILKPSEKDPSAPLLLAELFTQAGGPPGVLNVLHGDKTVVDALLSHADIQAVSFVGSTPVARYVYQTGIQHGKRVQAFGGAKNHCIVMPDADLEQTADAIVGAAYGSAGERCMAISVAVCIGDAVADELVTRMTPKVKTLRIGNGADNTVDIGPLITKEHREKVMGYVQLGIEEGAQLLVDGRELSVPLHESGFFMGGCLFDRVTTNMRIYQEEIFGPILCVLRAPDFETALTWVNQHPFGNGAAIFTNDGYTARTFASKVHAGMIGINVPIPVPMPFHPFGGWKQSTFADIHLHGNDSVTFYTKPKTVTSRWPNGKRLMAEFTIR